MRAHSRSVTFSVTIAALIAATTFSITSQVQAQTAQIDIPSPGRWLPLASGTEIWGPTNRYVWDSIPEFLTDGGFSFWQIGGSGWPGISYGKLTFSITQSGPAYMAVTSGFGAGGNPSGDWLPEVSYLPDLEADGWQLISGTFTDFDKQALTMHTDYLLLTRDSVAGETFTYRTEKYIPPIPLVQLLPPPPATTFFIDQAQSVINSRVVVGGVDVQEQAPGSGTTNLAGTLNVDLSNPDQIRFVDGGGFTLVDLPGVFEPGSEPAQLAGVLKGEDGTLVALGAVRDLTGSFLSGVLLLDSLGHFTPSGIINAPTGRIDYSVPALNLDFSDPLTGNFSSAPDGEIGTLETIGGQQKLTVPFSIFFDSGGPIGLQIYLTGQIVAYTVVPEPSSLTMATIALVSCAGVFGWRKLRSCTRGRSV